MPRYTEAELRSAVAGARSMSDVLRHFGLRPAGGNHRQLRRWLDAWQISIDHFAVDWPVPRRQRVPLADVLVERSTYHRGHLKRRLYEEGVKERRCELCGQGEEWRGQKMALILDHVNGVADDNRVENLRIVCPNCAASGWSAVGRTYGVSDNAIRKWVRAYEEERRAASCGAVSPDRGPPVTARSGDAPGWRTGR